MLLFGSEGVALGEPKVKGRVLLLLLGRTNMVAGSMLTGNVVMDGRRGWVVVVSSGTTPLAGTPPSLFLSTSSSPSFASSSSFSPFFPSSSSSTNRRGKGASLTSPPSARVTASKYEPASAATIPNSRETT